jgi:hypothetical protein
MSILDRLLIDAVVWSGTDKSWGKFHLVWKGYGASNNCASSAESLFYLRKLGLTMKPDNEPWVIGECWNHVGLRSLDPLVQEFYNMLKTPDNEAALAQLPTINTLE